MNVHFIDNYRGNAIKIGNRVAIAPGATFIADSDPNNSKLKTIEKYLIKGEVIIKDDAWIGSNVIILPNITIGERSIVGAGSIVTKNVEDNTIVAGNPAKVIGNIDLEK
ncbi:MAG: acyltransferase [Bacteroidales bacterium]|nr:acyltransferase [Bacteroidales bacterium]